MKENPEKDIYELINREVDQKLKISTSGLKQYKAEKIKENFEKIKPTLEINAK
jgi:hypothetical protein